MGGLVETKVEHMNKGFSLDGDSEIAVDDDDALREHNDTKHTIIAKDLTAELAGLRQMSFFLNERLRRVQSFAEAKTRHEESKQDNLKDNMVDEEEENIVFQPR